MKRLTGLLVSCAAISLAAVTSAQSITSPATTDGNPALSIPQAQLGYIAQGNAPTYVQGFSPGFPGDINTLPTASPANVGQYAVVSNLYGNTSEVMRSGYTAGFGYYWRPQRTDYGVALTATGGTLTLTPLVNAPAIFLSGTLASNLTINLSTVNAWPGATFQVANSLTLGLFSVSVTGQNLNALNMAQGASKSFVFDGTAWRPF